MFDSELAFQLELGKYSHVWDAYEHTSHPLRQMPGIVFLDAGG